MDRKEEERYCYLDTLSTEKLANKIMDVLTFTKAVSEYIHFLVQMGKENFSLETITGISEVLPYLKDEMKKAKIFYPEDLYDPRYRGQIFPLLKPFLKNRGFTDKERIDLYGLSSNDIMFVDDPALADVLILPMSWNYYVDTGKKELALEFIDNCSRLRKKIFIYNAGDKSYKIPVLSNVFLFRLSRNTRTSRGHDLVIPPFIQDPLKAFYHSAPISLRCYAEKPVVGFCGFAKSSKTDAGKELLKIEIQNLKSRLGLRNEEPQQFLSSSYFRGRILKILTKSTQVKTNFIVRKDYRAGVMHDISHRTVLEFYDNLRDSDYVLCARGSGNYSVRFYETLAMGRIPVYVEWKKHVVWVEKSEIKNIGKKIRDFHNNLNPQAFESLLISNRKLWEDHLTLGSYFKTILASEISANGREK